MNTCLRAYSDVLQKQVLSEFGALRDVPARKGSEQRSASEGTTEQGESRSKRSLI